VIQLMVLTLPCESFCIRPDSEDLDARVHLELNAGFLTVQPLVKALDK
jgi:hypothetical protein